MKTKKSKLQTTLLFLLPLCVALLVTGCEKEKEKEPQYEIYVSHEVSACGVEDPVVNIEWLRIICDKIALNKNNIHSDLKIDLYEENETKSHVILIPYSPDKGIFDYNVYDCSGKITVYFAGKTGDPASMPPQYPLGLYCTYVGTLWSLTIE